MTTAPFTSDPLIDARLGSYRIIRPLGMGGMGKVYVAHDETLKRPVAIKVFRPAPGNESPDSLERFRLEGRAACRFTHPNAVTVFDFSISTTGIRKNERITQSRVKST